MNGLLNPVIVLIRLWAVTIIPVNRMLSIKLKPVHLINLNDLI